MHQNAVNSLKLNFLEGLNIIGKTENIFLLALQASVPYSGEQD